MMGEHEVRLDGVVFLEGDAPGSSAADTSALALGAAQNWAAQRAAPDERLSRHRMRRLTGRHALVQLLLPVLVQSASTSTSPLRIISTVSPLYAIAAAQPTKFRPDDLDYTLKPAHGGDAQQQQQQRYPSGAPWEAEGRIALAAVLLWRELQARLASLATAKPGPTSTSSTTTSAAPILAVSVCPGLTRASLFATLAPSVRRAPMRLALAIVCTPLVWLLAKSADEAAQGVLGALLGPVEGESEAVRAAKGPEGAAVEQDEVKGGRKEVDSREGKRRMRVRGGALYREGREVRRVLCSLTLRRRRARPLELTEPLLRPQHRRSRRAPARGRRRPVEQRVQARRAAPRRCGRGAEARGPGQGGGQGASEGRGPGAAGRGEEGHLERSVATVPWTLCLGLTLSLASPDALLASPPSSSTDIVRPRRRRRPRPSSPPLRRTHLGHSSASRLVPSLLLSLRTLSMPSSSRAAQGTTRALARSALLALLVAGATASSSLERAQPASSLDSATCSLDTRPRALTSTAQPGKAVDNSDAAPVAPPLAVRPPAEPTSSSIPSSILALEDSLSTSSSSPGASPTSPWPLTTAAVVSKVDGRVLDGGDEAASTATRSATTTSSRTPGGSGMSGGESAGGVGDGERARERRWEGASSSRSCSCGCTASSRTQGAGRVRAAR